MKKLLTVSFLIMLAIGTVFLLSAEAASGKIRAPAAARILRAHAAVRPTIKQLIQATAVEDACTCGAPVNIPQQQVPFSGSTTQYKEFHRRLRRMH